MTRDRVGDRMGVKWRGNFEFKVNKAPQAQFYRIEVSTKSVCCERDEGVMNEDVMCRNGMSERISDRLIHKLLKRTTVV